MTQHPIPRYLSKPPLLFLFAVFLLALIAPMPFAIVSPGPVTDLLSKGIKVDNAMTTEGKLYSLSVFVTNPDSRPPGIMILESWLRGDSVVIPSEVVYKEGETTKSANAQGKKEMLKSEEAAAN